MNVVFRVFVGVVVLSFYASISEAQFARNGVDRVRNTTQLKKSQEALQRGPKRVCGLQRIDEGIEEWRIADRYLHENFGGDEP